VPTGFALVELLAALAITAVLGPPTPP